MPALRGLQPCAQPGCPTLVRRGRCTQHDPSRQRGSSTQQGYGAAHRRWRTAVLACEPFCRHCAAEGRRTVATVADHIVPLRQGGGWSLENGQALCKRCHDRKTAREGRCG